LKIAVATAGRTTFSPILEYSESQFRQDFDLNVTGTFLTLKHSCAAIAEAGGGSFVAVSSHAASSRSNTWRLIARPKPAWKDW
jgi:NAD(P)-dependent dehydrogenase (short-subunit alcohol dehydrogenase family)